MEDEAPPRARGEWARYPGALGEPRVLPMPRPAPGPSGVHDAEEVRVLEDRDLGAAYGLCSRRLAELDAADASDRTVLERRIFFRGRREEIKRRMRRQGMETPHLCEECKRGEPEARFKTVFGGKKARRCKECSARARSAAARAAEEARLRDERLAEARERARPRARLQEIRELARAVHDGALRAAGMELPPGAAALMAEIAVAGALIERETEVELVPAQP